MDVFTIKEFTDINAWKYGHQLVLAIYSTTLKFPFYERYSLGDQMRRSSVSVTSNIAEGFGRKTYKEKIQFYYQAQGSLTEIKNQILIARDVGYIKSEVYNQLKEKADLTHKLLQGLISSSKKKIHKS